MGRKDSYGYPFMSKLVPIPGKICIHADKKGVRKSFISASYIVKGFCLDSEFFPSLISRTCFEITLDKKNKGELCEDLLNNINVFLGMGYVYVHV